MSTFSCLEKSRKVFKKQEIIKKHLFQKEKRPYSFRTFSYLFSSSFWISIFPNLLLINAQVNKTSSRWSMTYNTWNSLRNTHNHEEVSRKWRFKNISLPRTPHYLSAFIRIQLTISWLPQTVSRTCIGHEIQPGEVLFPAVTAIDCIVIRFLYPIVTAKNRL